MKRSKEKKCKHKRLIGPIDAACVLSTCYKSPVTVDDYWIALDMAKQTVSLLKYGGDDTRVTMIDVELWRKKVMDYEQERGSYESGAN